MGLNPFNLVQERKVCMNLNGLKWIYIYFIPFKSSSRTYIVGTDLNGVKWIYIRLCPFKSSSRTCMVDTDLNGFKWIHTYLRPAAQLPAQGHLFVILYLYPSACGLKGYGSGGFSRV